MLKFIATLRGIVIPFGWDVSNSKIITQEGERNDNNESLCFGLSNGKFIADTDRSISQLLTSARACGVRSVNFSYAFYRAKFKGKLTQIPILENALREMTEYQSIASGKGYSLPLSEKVIRLSRKVQISEELGFEKVSACKCKNQIGTITGCENIELDCHFHHKWF